MNWDRYVGVPFDADRRHGTDCWGLVRLAYAKELGIALPEHAEISSECLMAVARQMKQSHVASPWIKVDKPQPFDVVLMSGLSSATSRIPIHVGLAISPSSMVHVSKETLSSVIVRLSSPMIRSRIRGFFRHERLATDPCRL